MGCGSGMTCWRRLRQWQEQGVGDRIHQVLLDPLREADRIDFDRAAVDSASIRALKRGIKSARTPPTAASPPPGATC
jgi:transposase